MTVKIVTDSLCDLPEEVIDRLDITVIPLRLQIGKESFRDDTVSAEEVVKRMGESPTTSVPPPNDLAAAYAYLLKEVISEEGAEAIVSIHISQKISGVCQSALQAKQILGPLGDKIEVIDSGVGAMSLGFVVMAAAESAQKGEKPKTIIEEVKRNVAKTHLLGIPDTIEYLYRGGRLSSKIFSFAKNAVEKLNVRICVTLKNGELSLSGTRFVRPANRISHLMKFIGGFPKIERLALEYSPDESGEAARIVMAVKKETAKIGEVYLGKLSPVICAHTGPGAVVVSVFGEVVER
jgi:DegV family protein with EDD domain